jgi:phospholipase C
METNITPWRRAVAGDLTSAFDFVDPNWFEDIDLPSTNSYKPTNLVRFPDFNVVPPTHQTLPKQEPGLRPARALPYSLDAHGLLQLSDGSFLIEFENTGSATAVFQVRSGTALLVPRTYTVGPGKSR